MFAKSVLQLGQPEGTVLYDLAAFPTGPSAVLARIPDGLTGIYAWFRSFHFSDDPDTFAEDLMTAIRAPKFQTRTGDLVPYYEVSLRSKSHISSGKEMAIKQALKDTYFLSALQFSLQWSILFQGPLYVGKSGNLRERIDQHLKSGSSLRERLHEAGIAIEKTYLLVVPTPIGSVDKPVEKPLMASDPDCQEQPTPQYELLFEEVFSRLFNPGFTIRLG
jgi:hypothetical protein